MSDNGLFTIYFEGEALPEAMCCVDVAALYYYLPDIPEDTQEWLWRFTVCLDKERVADSSEVRRHANLLRERITTNRVGLEAALLELGRDAKWVDEFIGAWQTGLERVCELSQDSETCRWIGRRNDELDDGSDSNTPLPG
jgi:hypothetical protein